MVNVAGRSKGCSTCRKRRVKCDESRPICQRCQKGGHECDGPKDVTFVVGTIVKSRRGPISPTRDSSRDVSQEVADYQIPQFLLPIGNAFHVYICYALRHLRRGGSIELTSRTIKDTDITYTKVQDIGQLSHQAVLSFAAIFFGAQHHQHHITRHGYAMHGVVLQRLNQALSDPKRNVNDGLIHAVITLGILEIFVSTGAGNHLKHMAGLERLLELRNHGSSISFDAAELYRSLRQMILFAALRSRKASILAQPEWKERMKTGIGSLEELQRQELYDILADCSVLIAQRDQILANSHMLPEKRAARLYRLRQCALSLLVQLSVWRQEWDRNEKHIYTEIPLTRAESNATQEYYGECGMPSFTTRLEFSSELVAMILMLYDIALIYVLQILALLNSPISNSVTTESPLLLSSSTPPSSILQDPAHFPDLWSEPYISANSSDHTKDNQYLIAQKSPILEICRSLPYHFSINDGATAAVVHWAVPTVWIKVRKSDSALGRWLGRLVAEKSPIIAKTLGVLAG